GKWDGVASVNEVQTLSKTGTVSGGTYTLSFDGETSAALNWNDNLATVQARLDAFAPGAGQIVATGGNLPTTPVTLTFSGSPIGGVVAWTADLQCSGAITRGTV